MLPDAPVDARTRATRAPSRWWRTPLVLLLVAFAVYLLTTATAAVSMDVRAANIASWRIATTGVPWLDGIAVPELDDNPLRGVWVLEAANGHTVIGRSPGVVAAALPAYWVTDSDTMSVGPGAFTAALLTAVAVMLMFLALRTRLTDAQALLAVLIFGFATPVWSIAANGMWPHTVTVLGISGMAWGAATGRWWLVGLFGGVTLWGRLHAAVVVAVLGLFVGWRRRDPGLVVRLGLAGVASLVLLIVWTRWMYGSWNPTASYDTSVFANYAETNRVNPVNQLGFWVSPDRGILVWTPLVALLIPALVRSWKQLPDWSKGLLWGGLTYTVLQATLNRFSGGDTFYGYRLGLEFLACAVPALAFAAPHMGRWARRLFGPVAALQCCAIMVGASVESFFVLPEDVWEDNAFVVALREHPAVLVPLCVVSVCAGLLAQKRWEGRFLGVNVGR